MPIDNLDEVIDNGLSTHFDELVTKALLKNAGKMTLGDLAEWVNGDNKYGPNARKMTLQAVIDAYVESHGLVPGETEATTETKKPKKAKGAAKKPKKAREGSSDGKGGGGGTADPGKEVNFRDPGQKEDYIKSITEMIQERGGSEITTAEIKGACGGSPNQAREILVQLVTDGLVVYTGKARATRYFWKADASQDVLDAFQKLQEALEEKKAQSA